MTGVASAASAGEVLEVSEADRAVAGGPAAGFDVRGTDGKNTKKTGRDISEDSPG